MTKRLEPSLIEADSSHGVAVLHGMSLIKNEVAPLPALEELAVILLLCAVPLKQVVAGEHDIKGAT